MIRLAGAAYLFEADATRRPPTLVRSVEGRTHNWAALENLVSRFPLHTTTFALGLDPQKWSVVPQPGHHKRGGRTVHQFATFEEAATKCGNYWVGGLYAPKTWTAENTRGVPPGFAGLTVPQFP